jgi:hypothetical protein
VALLQSKSTAGRVGVPDPCQYTIFTNAEWKEIIGTHDEVVEYHTRDYQLASVDAVSGPSGMGGLNRSGIIFIPEAPTKRR